MRGIVKELWIAHRTAWDKRRSDLDAQPEWTVTQPYRGLPQAETLGGSITSRFWEAAQTDDWGEKLDEFVRRRVGSIAAWGQQRNRPPANMITPTLTPRPSPQRPSARPPPYHCGHASGSAHLLDHLSGRVMFAGLSGWVVAGARTRSSFSASSLAARRAAR
jgi:hypothetical protein